MVFLIRKEHFNFGETNTVGLLYLKRSFSNVFLTLTDLDNKVILCLTAGSSGITGSKRKKKVPQALETIVSQMSEFLKLYELTQVRIVLKMKMRAFFYTLVRELEFYGFEILGVKIRRRIAFNGVRGRKLRRI